MVLVPGWVENLVLLLQNKEAESIARHPTHREHHHQVPSVRWRRPIVCKLLYSKAYYVIAAVQRFLNEKPPRPVKVLCHLQSRAD